ncbi:YheC/YheD family protein [Cohnella nanjingensis]|uniref:YheC/YheD family protein n=1 Tax=Cohnella nanjingensis TaxID=1387779 RepID=A0A7X0VD69_9BACL|nr:YheC/YheD family protein [Cohnella nanjingensis]MBB6669655.1 YheC/YheD family protein [Cohnella nanjingensis]
MKHTIVRSKMKKGKILMNDPILKHYVPATHRFRSSRIKRMLRSYSTLYIKPDVGRKGNGVIRVSKLNDGDVEISDNQTTVRCSKETAVANIKKKLKSKKKYLIQRGISLATYHGRPFDVRVVLQKPLNRWTLSLMSAKVAPKSSSVVTNVSKGALDVEVVKALQNADQRLNAVRVMRDLIDVSYQIAQRLGSRFPLKIIGLDMGIDKKGNVWFIEANTKPDCIGLEHLDRKLYRRYRRAKRMLARR